MPTTTEAENREIVRRLNDDVWQEGKVELIDELYTEDYHEHNAALPEDIHGRDGNREKLAMFHSAFSDITVTTEDLIAEGDKVAVRDRFTAVHDGEFMGAEPTGNRIEVQGMVIYRIEDGKAAEAWVQADMMGMMQQLGLAPEPEAGGE
jgi:predicted ester cyclase